MKQVVQSIKSGELQVVEVPAPQVRARGVLVRTRASLISAGTERSMMDFADKNLLQKAQARPDLVRQVFDMVQRDGLLATVQTVRNRLDQTIPLGYSVAGEVIAVGADTPGFAVGDQVACAGAGYANHAEFVFVPRNLAVKLPAGVTHESGAFATLGAIAMQGVRQAEVELGHKVAVIGLGLVGQLTVQMLNAAGCAVLGIDLDAQRVALARQHGAAAGCAPGDAAAMAQEFTQGRGCDRVLITAATKSNDPIELAGEISRDRGVVVAVGDVGLEVPRRSFYYKELDLRLSRSYGPGRYDPAYEEHGEDYPYGYVRWTEQRNMESFLELVAAGKVQVEPLITHRFAIEQAETAYELISGKTAGKFLGVVLQYRPDTALERRVQLTAALAATAERMRLGLIGAGAFANSTLLPAMKGIEGLELVGVSSGSGLSARTTAQRFGFSFAASSAQEILEDKRINTVAILTRHHLHAAQTVAALAAGKHVYVEKPLALTDEELDAILAAYERAGAAGTAPQLMAGFNRRFAPMVMELKQYLAAVDEPLMIHCRVNAGFIPPSHWTQDAEQGGGRLRGEACHFIDLLVHLAGAAPVLAHAIALPDGGRYRGDNLLVTVQFANGTLGTVTYVANGNKRFGKEMIEVFGGGVAARLDDYGSLEISTGTKQIQRRARMGRDKGHRGEWQAWVRAVTGKGPAAIPLEELVMSTRATLAAHRSLQSGVAEPVESRRKSSVAKV
jgi:predicted dehydrogenase/threonine dehydrogenase-like Zn-dependent dehydrogenase